VRLRLQFSFVLGEALRCGICDESLPAIFSQVSTTMTREESNNERLFAVNNVYTTNGPSFQKDYVIIYEAGCMCVVCGVRYTAPEPTEICCTGVVFCNIIIIYRYLLQPVVYNKYTASVYRGRHG